MTRTSAEPVHDLPPSRSSRFDTIRVGFTILALAYWLLYLTASLFPASPLWGVHHIAFLPLIPRVLVLATTLVLLIPPASSLAVSLLMRFASVTSRNRILFIGVVGFSLIITGLVLWHGTIATDMYGDSRTVLNRLAGKTYTFGDLVKVSETEPLSLVLHQSLSKLFGESARSTYRIVSVASGILFVLLTALFLIRQQSTVLWKVTMGIVLFGLGANQLFFGHIENYTVTHLLVMSFLMAGWQFFLDASWRYLIIMLVIFMIGTRMHIEVVLLMPALVYGIVWKIGTTVPAFRKLIQPRVLWGIIGGSLLLAGLMYAGVFRAYDVTGASQDELARRIFLPVINPLPAPHEYSLFSWKHGSDILQLMLQTTSPLAVVMLIGALSLRRKLAISTPRSTFYLLASLYVFLFAATVNPILSMPRDWDFLAIAGVPLAFLALSFFAPVFDTPAWQDRGTKLAGLGLALSLFVVASFFVNSQQAMVDARLRETGIWIYRSYYRGASYIIQTATLSIRNLQEQLDERIRILEQIMPVKSPSDYEAGFLYDKLGEAFFIAGDDTRAADAFQQAAMNQGLTIGGLKLLALAHFGEMELDRASAVLSRYTADASMGDVKDPDAERIREDISRAAALVRGGMTVQEVKAIVRARLQSTRDALARTKTGVR